MGLRPLGERKYSQRVKARFGAVSRQFTKPGHCTSMRFSFVFCEMVSVMEILRQLRSPHAAKWVSFASYATPCTWRAQRRIKQQRPECPRRPTLENSYCVRESGRERVPSDLPPGCRNQAVSTHRG